ELRDEAASQIAGEAGAVLLAGERGTVEVGLALTRALEETLFVEADHDGHHRRVGQLARACEIADDVADGRRPALPEAVHDLGFEGSEELVLALLGTSEAAEVRATHATIIPRGGLGRSRARAAALGAGAGPLATRARARARRGPARRDARRAGRRPVRAGRRGARRCRGARERRAHARRSPARGPPTPRRAARSPRRRRARGEGGGVADRRAARGPPRHARTPHRPSARGASGRS